MELVKKYTGTFAPRNGHSHNCNVCSKRLASGDRVIISCYKVEKYYPVKGLMGFMRWYYTHVACKL